MHTLSHSIWIGPRRLPYGRRPLRPRQEIAHKRGNRQLKHAYPTELHFSRLVQGLVMGSSKWLGLTRSA